MMRRAYLLLLLCAALSACKKDNTDIPEVTSFFGRFNGFVVGNALFVTTCLMGYNYEYRLVFLLLALPQMMQWYAENKPMILFSILLFILVLWQSFIRKYLWLFMPVDYDYLNSIPVIALFYFHLTFLVLFLKEKIGEFYSELIKPKYKTV